MLEEDRNTVEVAIEDEVEEASEVEEIAMEEEWMVTEVAMKDEEVSETIEVVVEEVEIISDVTIEDGTLEADGENKMMIKTIKKKTKISKVMMAPKIK